MISYSDVVIILWPKETSIIILFTIIKKNKCLCICKFRVIIDHLDSIIQPKKLFDFLFKDFLLPTHTTLYIASIYI